MFPLSSCEPGLGHFHLPAVSGGQSYFYGVIYTQLTCSKHILLYLCHVIPHHILARRGLGFQYHRGKKGTSERLSNLPKATQLLSGGAGLQQSGLERGHRHVLPWHRLPVFWAWMYLTGEHFRPSVADASLATPWCLPSVTLCSKPSAAGRRHGLATNHPATFKHAITFPRAPAASAIPRTLAAEEVGAVRGVGWHQIPSFPPHSLRERRHAGCGAGAGCTEGWPSPCWEESGAERRQRISLNMRWQRLRELRGPGAVGAGGGTGGDT